MKPLSKDELIQIETHYRLGGIDDALVLLRNGKFHTLIHTALLAHEMRDTLNEVASWNEGEEVGSRFDCPYHAELARESLKLWSEE